MSAAPWGTAGAVPTHSPRLRPAWRCFLGLPILASCAGPGPMATAQIQVVRPTAEVAVAAPSAAAAPRAKGGFALPEPAPFGAEQRDTLQRINDYRAAGATCGNQRFEAAPALAWNALLERTAAKHAQDMARRRSMSHTGGDGSSMSERVDREAYAWSALGENVSAGYNSVPDALAGWMKSPGHCANLMSGKFREVGVAGAHAPGDSFGWYRAMVLGSPAP